MKVSRSTGIAFLFLSAFLFQTDRLVAAPGAVPPGACLYALDPTASLAFQIAGAQPVYMAMLSGGADLGALNPRVIANAAKAAGIQIVSMQLSSSPSAPPESIASSSSDYCQAGM
jgi:hypothetical protein